MSQRDWGWDLSDQTLTVQEAVRQHSFFLHVHTIVFGHHELVYTCVDSCKRAAIINSAQVRHGSVIRQRNWGWDLSGQTLAVQEAFGEYSLLLHVRNSRI